MFQYYTVTAPTSMSVNWTTAFGAASNSRRFGGFIARMGISDKSTEAARLRETRMGVKQ